MIQLQDFLQVLHLDNNLKPVEETNLTGFLGEGVPTKAYEPFVLPKVCTSDGK